MSDNPEMDKLTQVQAKYVDELMTKAHVIGVGLGLAKEGDEFTDVQAIIVLVDEKVPADELDEADLIPSELDGVRVDVQERGIITANF